MERTSNNKKENEEPEEPDQLNISSPKFVDGYECDRASRDGTN